MEELRNYLAAHHGVITRGRARLLGLTDEQIRRRLRTGAFVRVGPNVYRLATSPATWSARARAAALSARGLVESIGALRVWGVDGFTRRPELSVAVGPGRQPRAAGVKIRRIKDFHLADGHLVDAIPVTGPARSVLDAASVLPAEELEMAVDAVIRQGLVSLADLETLLRQTGSRGRKGAGVLGRLLAERSPGDRIPDSRFNRLVGRLLVDAGLPPPVYEFNVRRNGNLIGRADLAYPEARLLIECDSARWHRNRSSFEADPRRRNRLILAGYQVLNFTWADYANRPTHLVTVVGAALEQRLCAPVSL